MDDERVDGNRIAAPAKPVARWHVRSFLVALAVVCTVPGVIGTAMLSMRDYAEGREGVERDTIWTARALVQAVDSRLLKAMAVAQTLASAEALRRGDFKTFHARARDLLAATGAGTNIVVSDKSGQQLVNTLRDFGQPLPKHGNPQLLNEVFSTGQGIISNVYVGGVLRRPVMSIDVPVIIDGKVVYDLSVGIMPGEFQRILTAQQLPPDWLVGIFDSAGTTAARSHQSEKFVGQKGGAEFIARIRSAPEGAIEVTSREGIRTVSMWSRSPVTGWSVGVGIPRDSLEAPLIRKLKMLGAGFGVLLAIGLALAWIMGARIRESVRSLTALANALATERPLPLPELRIAETAEVAAAIEAAARLLRERTAALEELNRSHAAGEDELERFSYAMSHDLRTPLRAIHGYSHILMEEHGDKLSQDGKRLIGKMGDAALRLGRMTDDMLHFLDIRRRRLSYDSVDVGGLVAGVFEQLQATRSGDRPLRLQAGELPEAWADREMIRQVYWHLMSNAAKFGVPDRETVIEVGGVQGDDENAYFVRDNGVGFDMRYEEKLFKVFERLHPTGEYEGTAMGLAVVKRIIERHGGRVWAEGKVGEGAVFHFTLPNNPGKDGIGKARQAREPSKNL